MEEKTKEESIEQRNTELLEGKTGKHIEAEKIESPLEEARRLNKEMKESTRNMDELSKKLDKQIADLAIGGRSFGGQKEPEKIDPKEEARKKGEEYAKQFLSR